MSTLAYQRLRWVKKIVIIPGAGHPFEEAGTPDQVMEHAKRWLLRFLPGRKS